eukprot:TRINITY_DN5727_c0_g1_i1.p1 TRINITY_DN5727_c0_g1~~TRINITY_DN5727_c0_g1_i1.p1  ORF type:complete len:846 (+),score=232.93 TRINITY_DN5727_c0_g1_i1:48-2585(+)
MERRDFQERPQKHRVNVRALKHNREFFRVKNLKLQKELDELEKRSATEAPAKGTVFPIGTGPVRFADLPITRATFDGLSKASYVNMTEIQRTSIPHALAGRDVLGAAKTGSGKTVAFLVPVLERLARAKWTQHDGVGAIVITPTRELALQIFDVLKKIGRFHSFSAGLVIGGKDLKIERNVIGHMNILICTPGRLLQHMDETSGFECSNLQILVLDEADRILDLGFSKSMNAIIENLPIERQTLLFSATQTKSVQDLARLSLKEPEYVSIYKESVVDTPQKLVQHYMVCPLQDKMDLLYSFIKTHLKVKSIVFLSTCKQVRFVYEAFCRMRPGVPVLCLHGKMKQHRRLEVYYEFCEKKAAVIFATDIAARGLDFPAVDWVLQVDCPEDLATYIHRVGRTARYQAGGRALLFLLPSEESGMVKLFDDGKIPVKKILANPDRKLTTLGSLQQYITEDPEFKYLAQKAFISYMRSIYLMPNKEIFDVHKLPTAEYSLSLGLIGTPKIKFGGKEQPHSSGAISVGKSQQKVQAAKQESDDEGEDDDDLQPTEAAADDEPLDSDDEDEEGPKKTRLKTRVDRLYKRRNATIYSESYKSLRDEQNESDDDELLVVKRVDHDLDKDIANIRDIASKKSIRKIKLAGNSKTNRIIFDDEGNVITEFDEIAQRPNEDADKPLEKTPEFLEKLKEQMSLKDKQDRQRERERVKQKHQKEKLKKKKRDQSARGDVGDAPTLGDGGDYEYEDEDGSASDQDDNSGSGSDNEQDFGDEAQGRSESEEDDTHYQPVTKSAKGADKDIGRNAGVKRKGVTEKSADAFPNQRRRTQEPAAKADMSLEDMEKMTLLLLGKK